jgi:hypothetical protein
VSANDLILLDKILEQLRVEESPSLSASEFFELFAINQVLKDFDVSYDEIASGIVDNGGDGGIDAVYVFVNGELLTEDFDFSTRRKNIEIELVLIQAKTAASFSESAMDKFHASAEDLLDLRKSTEAVSTVYNEPLRQSIQRFREAYGNLASRLPRLKISYYYATRGEEVHPNVARKVERLEEKVRALFSDVEFSFEFIGAARLMTLLRRQPKTTYALRLSETPISSKGAFIGLVGLKDFHAFITDEKVKLRRSLFESNVRDYQGTNPVNDEIQETLKSKGSEDFWWLNNGVTILASRPGTLSGDTLTIEDPQVVNGLQTSTEIYKFFQTNDKPDERRVLVRVIAADTADSQDRIIKATNSQTSIPAASLHATEKIHRDIEQYLKSSGFFYDRRKNFYKNEGKGIDKIISIPYLAQAVMAIALQRPDSARARPSSLLKDENDYKKVFSDEHPLQLYAACVMLMKRVDVFLRSEEIGLNRKDQTNLRYYVAMVAAMKVTGTEHLKSSHVASLAVDKIKNEELTAALNEAKAAYTELGSSDQAAKGPELLKKLRIEPANSSAG